MLILLFGTGLLLALAPFEAAWIRLAGVGILWWYSLALAPLLAALTVVPLLLRGRD